MNARTLALVGTAAAAGGGGWPWLRETVWRAAEAAVEEQAQEKYGREGQIYAQRGPHGSWWTRTTEWTGERDAAGWAGVAGLVFAIGREAYQWYRERCGPRRRRRLARLEEFDDLASATTDTTFGANALAASEYQVTPEELLQWAAAWSACAAGPKQFTRVTAQGRREA